MTHAERNIDPSYLKKAMDFASRLSVPVYDGRPCTFVAPDFHSYFHAAAVIHGGIISPAAFRDIASTSRTEVSDVEMWLSRLEENRCVTTCMRQRKDAGVAPLPKQYKHVARAAGILLLSRDESSREFSSPDGVHERQGSPIWTRDMCKDWLYAYSKSYYPKPTDLMMFEQARIYAKLHLMMRRADRMLTSQGKTIASRTLRPVTRKNIFYLAYGCTDDSNCRYEPFKARQRPSRAKVHK